MNLYQTRHPFYCGIDLHAKQMYACVVDQHGNKLLHRNFKTRNADKFFQQIEPFGNDIAVGCESTFNWYWLADACHERKIPFILGRAPQNNWRLPTGLARRLKQSAKHIEWGGVGQNEFLPPCCNCLGYLIRQQHTDPWAPVLDRVWESAERG